MKVLIGGGTGFIGQHVARLLRTNGYNPIVVSRGPQADMTWDDLDNKGLPENCEAVINVAGNKFLNLSRWNEEMKTTMKESRVGTTSQLVRAIHASHYKPKVYIGVTGVAYYEPSEVKEYTENTTCENYDFFSELVSKWESASESLDDIGVRRVIVRSGIVLGRDGGVISNVYWPFLFCLGGPIGSGNQWFPWIHIDDITGIITHSVLNPEVTGILNGVAPGTCTNSEFTQSFAQSLFRFAVLPTPGFMLNFVLGPERARVMLEGQKVIPKRTLESGYKFEYPNIKEACQAL